MEITTDSVFSHTFNTESDIIDIKKYFGNYGKLLTPLERCKEEKCKTGSTSGCETDTCKNDQFYLNFLGITKSELKELKDRTSVEHLTCDGEMETIPTELHKKLFEVKLKQKATSDENKSTEPLASVKSRLELKESGNEFTRTFFKYCNHQWTHVKDKLNNLQFNSEDLSSVVVCVKVYHPFVSQKIKASKIKLLQEIHVLANQTLADLKDKIMCYLDHVGADDLSDECFLEKVGAPNLAKDKYPSSFIFIENTFYNDTRSSKMKDLSKDLREWATSKGLGSFKCACMENSRLCDIKLKIGRPYVYQHQGNCEHVLLISDIRFLEIGDCGNLKSYPRIHSMGRIYGKHCMMCGDLYARWLVVRNERLTHDRTYLCKKCFISYNYINKKKIGKFEAYEYVDPIALL